MATAESRKLNMTFASVAGKNATLTLDSPTADLDSATVSTAMEGLIDTSVFTDSDGSPLVQAKSARMITTTIEELF